MVKLRDDATVDEAGYLKQAEIGWVAMIDAWSHVGESVDFASNCQQVIERRTKERHPENIPNHVRSPTCQTWQACIMWSVIVA